MEQEKKKAQNNVNLIACKSDGEKNRLVSLLITSEVTRETSLLRQVVDLEEKLNCDHKQNCTQI